MDALLAAMAQADWDGGFCIDLKLKHSVVTLD